MGPDDASSELCAMTLMRRAAITATNDNDARFAPVRAQTAHAVDWARSELCCGAEQTSILVRSECRLPSLLADWIVAAANVRNPPLLPRGSDAAIAKILSALG